MRPATLVRRALHYYRPAHLAVVAGVATAAAVLAGALAVGDSVRESLARIALARLGKASHAVTSTGFFREALASELSERVGAPCVALVSVPGVAVAAVSGRRASDVLVYGVDERFWSFHAVPASTLQGRETLLSEALGKELGVETGDSVLLRLGSASEIPASSLFGRRDARAQSLRVTLRGVLARSQLGEFALEPARGAVRAAFVPLALLQRTLGVVGRANSVLMSVAGEDSRLAASLRAAVGLEDLGLRLRTLPASSSLQLESTSTLLDDTTARVARDVALAQGLRTTEVLSYLATAIRHGDRELPYSLVAALDDASLRGLSGRELAPDQATLYLNAWAAADLGAAPGARLDLDYYVWEQGRLETRSAAFRFAGVVAGAALASDRNLVPDYPGITDAPQLSDWDPPFPVHLDRIRPKDEAYWHRFRTTPKAFVSLTLGQELWGHRLGRLTALRLEPGPGLDLQAARGRFAATLLAALTREQAPLAAGSIVVKLSAARRLALAAAQGSTDFGAYFVYFSFFLVAASLLLAGLFFRLGIEQRAREVGLLRAVGFDTAAVRRQFLGEGAVLSGLGGLLGVGAAAAYAALVLWGLRSLWSPVLPTSDLILSVSPRSLGFGALGASAAALLAIVWTLRDVERLSPRALLTAAPDVWDKAPARVRLGLPAALTFGAAIFTGAAAVGGVPQAAGFFGAGGLLLVSAVLSSRLLIGGRPPRAAAIPSVAALGRRGASFRPGRSLLCVALLAAASFVIVAVGAFRREGADYSRKQGEAGGYSLLAWSLLPLHEDLTSPEGRAAFDLSPSPLQGVSIARFRASRGEDASCLNLNRPQRPTVLAPGSAFLREARFSFQASLAQTPATRLNPWLLLEGDRGDGAIPAIADASSLAYVLHKKLGEVMELEEGVRLRFVGALAPGLLQGEVLVGERHFLDAFPHESGHRFFLIETPAGRDAEIATHLESQLGDFGFDVTETAARLSAFHRVENTYISTFQALGALGLLVGTAGLATVLIRNALEQRRELALLRAVGYRDRHLLTMLLNENALLLILGLAAGVLPALLAIGPALQSQRGALPWALLVGLVLAVALTGAFVSWLAVAVIRRVPLLQSLRAE